LIEPITQVKDFLQRLILGKLKFNLIPAGLMSIEITNVLSLGIGIAGSALAVTTYRQNQVLKRQEILLPLIKDFEESGKLEHAREILDYYILNKGEKPNEGWNIKEENYYSRENLRKILRYHKAGAKDGGEGIDRPIEDKGEIQIRNSFTALLDFLGRLGYLLDIGVITPKEVRYFEYYIREVKEDPALIRYAQIYDFRLFAVLLDKLGILPPDLSETKAAYYDQFR
jgi:hypothetical protein